MLIVTDLYDLVTGLRYYLMSKINILHKMALGKYVLLPRCLFFTQRGIAMNNIQSALVGTKTEENLYTALAGESKAHTKYDIFASMAEKENNAALADMYRTMSRNEKEHAELWMSYLGENGTTLENLENSEAGEMYESGTMYENFATTARNEGFDEIAEKFSMVGSIEASHAKKVNRYIQMVKDDRLFSSPEKTTWLCTNCGYLYDGNSAPVYCPVCGYPQGYFERERR